MSFSSLWYIINQKLAIDHSNNAKACSYVLTILIGVEAYDGIGKYNDNVSSAIDSHNNHQDNDRISAAAIAKLLIGNNICWVLIVNINKASILVQYLRIFTFSNTLRWICRIMFVALLTAACWGILGGTLLCTPTAKLWSPELPGRCMNPRSYWLSVAAVDIVLDFSVFALPLRSIISLHIPRRQMIALKLIFSLGFFVCLVGIARVATVLVKSLQGDHVESGVWSIIWSAVEANAGIICASLLSLKPLIVEFFPHLLDEKAPPKHCMRLPMIETRTWPGDPSNESIVFQRTASMFSVPSSIRKLSKTFSRPSTAQTMTPRQASFPPSPRLSDEDSGEAGPQLSFMEALQQTAGTVTPRLGPASSPRLSVGDQEVPTGEGNQQLSFFEALRQTPEGMMPGQVPPPSLPPLQTDGGKREPGTGEFHYN
jgi:hypothetical protein